MALDALVTRVLTTPTTRTGLGVHIGGRILTAQVQYDSLSMTDGGSSAGGRLTLHLSDVAMADLPEVYDRAQIRILDHGAGDDAFRGYVIRRRPSKVPGYTGIDLVATDMGGLLDEAFIAYAPRPAETMKARIAFVWGYYATHDLSRDMSHVATIGATLPAQELVSLTLRQAIEAIISQASASADYYVDSLGRLHVFTSQSNDAPLDVDVDAPGAGEFAPHDLDIDYDASTAPNQVYVQGGNAAGSGYVVDHAALGAANGVLITAAIQAPDCTTAAMARSLAQMYLGRVAGSTARGTFSATSPDDGWRGGQNVLVTSADHGLSAQSFRIVRVTTTILKGGTSPTRRYRIEFGAARARGATEN